MEPFFIFCGVLVIYCFYLTFIDLLKGRKTATVSAPTVRRAAERVGKTFPVRRRSSSVRGRSADTTGHFPVFSRGTA
jgi:hypothetical protein